MTPGNQIRSLIGENSSKNEWPNELAQPNHIVWQLGRHLRSSDTIANMDEIQDFLNDLQCPGDSECVEALFFGMINLLKAACCSCPDELNTFLAAAGTHYSALLEGFHENQQVILKWGKIIADLTYCKLKNNGQAKEALTKGVGSTTILTIDNRSFGSLIPLLVEKCTQSFSKPALIFDPIHIGLLNFDLENENNFLKASVLPAWQYYLAEFKEASQSMIWGFPKIPFVELGKLNGPSAGAAFFLAMKSAHTNFPLDPTIAISVAIVHKGAHFTLNSVDGIDQKTAVANKNNISKILVFMPKKTTPTSL